MIKLEDIKIGTIISCKLLHKNCFYAKIQIEHNSVYICQNTRCGISCKNKLGFKYSWVICQFSELIETDNDITKFFNDRGITDIIVLSNRNWDNKTN